MRKIRVFKKYLLAELKDPKYAKAYIALALEKYDQDKDMQLLLDVLEDVLVANADKL